MANELEHYIYPIQLFILNFCHFIWTINIFTLHDVDVKYNLYTRNYYVTLADQLYVYLCMTSQPSWYLRQTLLSSVHTRYSTPRVHRVTWCLWRQRFTDEWEQADVSVRTRLLAVEQTSLPSWTGNVRVELRAMSTSAVRNFSPCRTVLRTSTPTSRLPTSVLNVSCPMGIFVAYFPVYRHPSPYVTAFLIGACYMVLSLHTNFHTTFVE